MRRYLNNLNYKFTSKGYLLNQVMQFPNLNKLMNTLVPTIMKPPINSFAIGTVPITA